jgi:hypothetical protein
MTESSELARAVMSRGTRLHANQARRQPCKELDKLLPPDLPADGNPAAGINGMDLQHRFGEVQTNCCDLSHELRSLSSTLNGAHLGTVGSGSHPPHRQREQFLFWSHVAMNGRRVHDHGRNTR